jgi:tRNA-splicing ligase RtcB
MWAPVLEVESEALDQLKNVASLPENLLFKHVAAMPDIHAGVGATVGTVIATRNMIIPSAVGVDIGCGMDAVKTSLRSEYFRKKDLQSIFEEIQLQIPTGFSAHEKAATETQHMFLWKEFPELNGALQCWDSLAKLQMGTLGGGNHFIEISEDTDGAVWIMLHSGSRRIGKEIADYYIKEAIGLHQQVPDKALNYLTAGTELYDDYIKAASWAQRYAKANRALMLTRIMEILEGDWKSVEFDAPISCHHNYFAEEEHYGEKVIVTRKGAISARQGQMGIIPGAMGRASYIVRGLGNEESFTSAPHGAGRKMSRSKAKKKYKKSDVAATMGEIICRTDDGVIDEICYAYKKIEEVIQNASDLVEPVTILNQLVCIKG